MTATTPEQRDVMRDMLKSGRIVVATNGPDSVTIEIPFSHLIADALKRLLAERDALAAEVERLREQAKPRPSEGAAIEVLRKLLELDLYGTEDRERVAHELAKVRVDARAVLGGTAPAKGEIVRERYAISHAPKGVKGGPWEAIRGGFGTPTYDKGQMLVESYYPKFALFDVQRRVPRAHVVRFVTRKKAPK